MQISTLKELEDHISFLKQKKEDQEQEFKDNFQAAKEWIKPKNILKRTLINTVSKISQFKPDPSTLLKAGAGVGAAVLAKKFLGKKFLKIAGFVLPVFKLVSRLRND